MIKLSLYFTVFGQKIRVTKIHKPDHTMLEGIQNDTRIFWEKTVKRFLSLLLILAVNQLSVAQSISIEDKIEVKAGRMASVTIKSDGKSTSYVALPAENLDIFREYDPDPSVIKLRLLSYSNGTFYIVASTTLNDKIVSRICVVTVGVPIPVPIPPDIVPNVDAQIIKNLKAVYAADPSPDKESELEALIALYDQGSVFVKTRSDLKTYGQVWSAFGDVAKTLGCSKKLIAVQQLIQNYMQVAGIPINAADGATAVNKDQLVPQLQRVANLLKQVK